MKINITDEIRQEILDMLNRDTVKEYFEKLRDTEKNPTRGQVYAYRSWEQSTEDRADMFEVRALPWGSQIKDGVMKEFVAALTAADIDEIRLSSLAYIWWSCCRSSIALPLVLDRLPLPARMPQRSRLHFRMTRFQSRHLFLLPCI